MKRINRLLNLNHIAEINCSCGGPEFTRLYLAISKNPYPFRQLALCALGYSGLLPRGTYVLKLYAVYCEIIEIRAFGKTFSGLSPPPN